MADGSIKISIEVDGKQVDVAAKQLDNLEASGSKSGKGVKSAEDSLNSLSDASGKAGSNVKGAGDSIEGLGDSGSKAGQGLKGAEGAIDGVADSSAQAASSVKGAGDTIEGLGASGSTASQGLQGVDGALDGVADSSAQASDSVRGMSDSMSDVDGKTNQASGSIKTFAASIGLIAIAATAFNAMRSSMDQAISRFDTLNAFPKVLQALGVSAEDSDAAMAKLSDGIDGLPTKLNDIAGSAQRMYTSFGDMDKATDTALALNNALLGSGASADEAKRGTDQYIKALQTGTINMDTWNTLSETMDVGLVKIAEGFGFAGASAKDDLYNALQDGTITMDEFNNKLIEVGTGTGIMAELAKENSLGIATSFGNLRNAIANGVAKIIEAFNNLSIAVTGKDIAQNIDSMKVVVNAAFDVMKGAIEATTPVFKVFGEAVKLVIAAVKPFTPAILGLAGAFAALMIINKVASVINAANSAIAAARISSQALTLATKGQIAAQATSTTMTKADTIAKAANLGMINASTLAIGVLTGRIKMAQAAKIAWAAVTRGLNAVLGVMSGPIGIATLAIGALVGATIGIVKWFKSSSEESERLKEEVEKMGEETDSLTDSVDSNADAYSEQVSSINANKDAQNELLGTVTNLSEKENKSEEDKQALKEAVDQLNGSVDGLNVMYNEEADRLSESSEKIQQRIDLMSDLESGQAAQERYTEILQDQSKIEEQLNEVLEKKEGLMVDGKIATADAHEASEALTEQEEQLRAKLEELGDEKKATEEKMTAAQDAIKQAVEDGNASMILSYDVLSDAQQDAFEQMKDRYESLKEVAHDAFEKIETDSEISLSKMVENMQHNQKAVEEWGENQAALLEWAGKNGYENFIPYIEEMGIDQAGYLNEMVKGVDESNEEHAAALVELAETYGDGFGTAAEAGKASLGEGLEEVGDILISMVEDGTLSTQEAIEAANFYELFGVLPDDAAAGIEGGSSEVEKESELLANKAYNTISNAITNLGFFEEGKRITDETAEGVEAGGPNAEEKGTNVANKVFNSVSSTLNSLNFKGEGKGVSDDTAAGIDEGSPNASASGESLATNVFTTVSNNMTASKYEGVGKNVGQGLAGGIMSMMDTVTSAVRTVASNAESAGRSELGVQSPSRVFFAIGEFVGAGMEGGILSKQASIIQSVTAMTTAMINRTNIGMQTMNRDTQAGINRVGVNIARLPVLAQTSMTAFGGRLSAGASMSQSIMSRLSTNMVSPFRSLPGVLSGIGSSAISGLNAGLNGGAGRVMSTARNIASRVASTMKSALKINSPSHIMRDDVGRWVPAGIAVGIEDNAKMVYRAMDDLAAGMIKPVSPEVALGTSSMAYNGADSISQAVKNIRIPENKPDGSVASLLREQNGILNRLLNKESDTYLDGEKLTKVVNENNAILASLSAF
ncbi:tape measure protein [Oceanobacillus oncorhynchi]|uniref:tape measure protein n=1 Tax=Oceanobacillus oncorhynchi TaxID=545501 RepID=UPI00186608E9|nr:tape measure protein [Oceanobacillus oncorhynchi]